MQTKRHAQMRLQPRETPYRGREQVSQLTPRTRLVLLVWPGSSTPSARWSDRGPLWCHHQQRRRSPARRRHGRSRPITRSWTRHRWTPVAALSTITALVACRFVLGLPRTESGGAVDTPRSTVALATTQGRHLRHSFPLLWLELPALLSSPYVKGNHNLARHHRFVPACDDPA